MVGAVRGWPAGLRERRAPRGRDPAETRFVSLIEFSHEARRDDKNQYFAKYIHRYEESLICINYLCSQYDIVKYNLIAVFIGKNSSKSGIIFKHKTAL